MALDMDLAEHEDFAAFQFLLNLAIMGKPHESIGSSLDIVISLDGLYQEIQVK